MAYTYERSLGLASLEGEANGKVNGEDDEAWEWVHTGLVLRFGC